MPKLTVAVAVYNGAASLAKVLECVFEQTYRDFEVLVLDDGSTDESAAIAQSFDVRYVHQTNAGLGAARQRLTELSNGEYIAFVDHDDFWTPTKLELQMTVIDSEPVDLIHADGWYVYEDGREVPRDWNWPPNAHAWDHILPSNRVIASTAIYRKQAMLDAGNFVPDTVRCSDWYGWMLLAPQNRFRHVPEKLVRYSVLSTSLANAGLRFHRAQLYFLENHLHPRLPELMANLPAGDRNRYAQMVRNNIGTAWSGIARHLHKDGKKKEAREAALRALKSSPTVPKVLTRSLAVLLT